jgi:hypothetical protein
MVSLADSVANAREEEETQLQESKKVSSAPQQPEKDSEDSDKDSNRCLPTKIQIIVKQLRALKEKYPSDCIYITGHSLGGALSLIAALSVATDRILSSMPEDTPPDITPVTCITLGNPKPGNRAFSNALCHLERTKKLRCLCIHNTLDIVPMTPPQNAMNRDGGFWHPGFRLLLYKHRFELGRSHALKPEVRKIGTCDCRTRSQWSPPKGLSLAKAAKNMTRQRINRHSYREYLERLWAQETSLSSVSLNDLYHEIWSGHVSIESTFYKLRISTK